MDTTTTDQHAPSLYRIEGYVDLWVDACLRDSEGEFKFLSLYGRDSSAMQFISALQLGAGHEQGISRFWLTNERGDRQMVDAPAPESLDKHSVRLPRENIFGPISQMWIHDKCLREVDRANRIGWIMLHDDQKGREGALDDMAWQMVRRLSPVALLQAWREPLLQWCRNSHAVSDIGNDRYPPIGAVRGMRVSISDHFVRFVSEGVRTGALEH